MFLSVYYRDYLQLVLCVVAYYCAAGLNWSLDQIEDIYSAYKPSHMLFLGFGISMISIHDELDDMVRK